MKKISENGDMPQEKKADEISSFSEDCRKEEQKKLENKETKSVEKPKFPGYKLDKDGVVKKLGVGEYVQGLLIAKEHSSKYDAGIYKIKAKDTDVPIVLLGSTVLDKKMKLHDTGEEIIIERAPNSVNQKQQDVHNWNIYSKE